MRRKDALNMGSLVTYFLLLFAIAPENYHLLLIPLSLTILFYVLHRIIGDDILFYIYFFFALIAAVVPFAGAELEAAHIFAFYLLLLPLFVHFVQVRFGKYGKIHLTTYLVYLLAPPVSALAVVLFLSFPLLLGTIVISLLVIVIALLYHLAR